MFSGISPSHSTHSRYREHRYGGKLNKVRVSYNYGSLLSKLQEKN